ncbi:hypothetical protein LJR084_004839 [Variovorax sp. LjRoot84]|uniref:hypothetical protein n=1 Tax=Variovorax sp. LjRoot84 TaxID=3342340 RepID=UPI003ED0129B
MEPAELYARLKAVVKDMPELEGFLPITPEVNARLGRAYALVKIASNGADEILFGTAAQHLNGVLRDSQAQTIKAVLYRALAHAELQLPADEQGAFVAVKSKFEIIAVLSGVLRDAKHSVLIVDPYIDAVAVTDFAGLVPEGVPVLLLGDQRNLQPNLAPAIARWKADYPKRPIEARMAPERALHDRLVIVDQVGVWNLSQSIKDFAGRSPASIEHSKPEIAELKVAAYWERWDQATPLV